MESEASRPVRGYFSFPVLATRPVDGRGCGRPSAGKRRRGAALLPLRYAAGVLERPFRESLRQVRALVYHLKVTRSVPCRPADVIVLWSVTRLNGCYEALEGGNTTEALIDFTGGVSEPLSLDRAALRLRSDERRTLFQTLAKAHERKALITCSIRVRFFSLPEPSSESQTLNMFPPLSQQRARRWSRCWTAVLCEDTPTGSRR